MLDSDTDPETDIRIYLTKAINLPRHDGNVLFKHQISRTAVAGASAQSKVEIAILLSGVSHMTEQRSGLLDEIFSVRNRSESESDVLVSSLSLRTCAAFPYMACRCNVVHVCLTTRSTLLDDEISTMSAYRILGGPTRWREAGRRVTAAHYDAAKMRVLCAYV